MAADLAGMQSGTPERFVPELMPAGLIAIDHHARYWWVAQLARGRRVLDAACGVAYGSAILRDAGASEVVGVDRAADVLAEVAPQVGAGVRLQEGTLEQLPFADGEFDLVVCFEAIEHVPDPERVLDELARVCAPQGILALSSPNREVYVGHNPHHVREFLPDELDEALRRRFAQVRLLHQQDWLASGIVSASPSAAAGGTRLEGVDVRALVTGAGDPQQFILALASDGELPALDELLVLGDPLESRLRRLRRENEGLRAAVDEQRRRRRKAEKRARRAEERLARLERLSPRRLLRRLRRSSP